MGIQLRTYCHSHTQPAVYRWCVLSVGNSKTKTMDSRYLVQARIQMTFFSTMTLYSHIPIVRICYHRTSTRYQYKSNSVTADSNHTLQNGIDSLIWELSSTLCPMVNGFVASVSIITLKYQRVSSHVRLYISWILVFSMPHAPNFVCTRERV